MSTQFRERIRLSIADEPLQAALDANAARRVQGRLAAFASLPDWQERRQRAHAIRAEVIAHLEEQLELLIENATANGIQVHRAADAGEAVRLVLEAAGASHGKKLFAKSKSMVSEEIGLNHALEQRGHEVVETDLGEYIVQLRGEKPSHIITPAVHLRRHQVGELFHEKLGMPYTEDIPTLTAAARGILRQVFLTADVGISGVNFAVTQTGTLCVVTNEGNGRMVTTIPPVHIALMGMERLVPTLADLALMLSLLPRSATGQKLSVYTQLIHSPRRPGELDGARERHLIIVDNGRSKIRGSGLREALYCIRCGACLNACPVFREIGGHAYVGTDGSLAPYPGPIGSIVSPGLLGLNEFGQLAQASSLCGACKDACPVDIDLPKLLTRVRGGQPRDKSMDSGIALSPLVRLGLRAYAAIGASAQLFHISQRLAAVGARILSPASGWMRAPAFTRWGTSKDFPRPAWTSFHERWRGQNPTQEAPRSPEAPAPRTAVVPDSREESSQAELVRRFATELEALGAQVTLTTSADVTGKIVALLRERGVEKVLASNPIEDLGREQLTRAGFAILDRPEADAGAGITGCTAAIAETGTLLVEASGVQPLSMSLLPEIHVAIVRTSQIVWSLEQAFSKHRIQEKAAAVLISGPSRTADIEMTLTIGVHGPRELAVFVVQ